MSTTIAPQLQTASRTAAVCQWTGRASATVLPGPTSNSSWSRFADLATQLANVVPESSIRSPVASSYWVTSGAAASRRRTSVSRSAGSAGTGSRVSKGGAGGGTASVDAGGVGRRAGVLALDGLGRLRRRHRLSHAVEVRPQDEVDDSGGGLFRLGGR